MAASRFARAFFSRALRFLAITFLMTSACFESGSADSDLDFGVDSAVVGCAGTWDDWSLAEVSDCEASAFGEGPGSRVWASAEVTGTARTARAVSIGAS